MVENSIGSPVFAGRYRFQTVGNDWDTGRSGFTHLVFDIQKERLGVIKRAETKSQQAVDGLRNEVAALLDLKGLGVPEVYDTGETKYGSKSYFYMVIEYVDGIRIEKNLDFLSTPERAEILTQFFDLLANSHRMGIVNGDVDLKHLFWRKDKKRLIVIDWGNAKLNQNRKNRSEFAYDLARSAEIIYALVARRGRAPVSGSLALPKDTSLMPSLVPVPPEFRTLCKWAPRTPTNGSQSPLTALELYDATKRWMKGVPYKTIRQTNWGMQLVFIAVLISVAFLGIAPNLPAYTIIFPPIPTTIASSTLPPATFTEVITQTETVVITETIPTETSILTESSTLTPTITQTPPILVTPAPRTYTTILLDTSTNDFPSSNCWSNNPATSEGLSRRLVDQNMQFKVDDGQPTNDLVETDFSTCFKTDQITAIGLNAWIQRIELERTISGQSEDGRQFGIFLEDIDGQRREYTLWVDKNKKVLLRVRERNEDLFNKEVFIINQGNLKIQGNFPSVFAEFPIQIFLELNNQGLDIIYLKEGPNLRKAVEATSLSPAQMIAIDKATRPTLSAIVKIGLIGYGGETQIIIWPLAIFGN